MKKKLPFFAIILALSFCCSSCAYVFNALVFPNQCTRCTVVDHFGEIIYDSQECGGANVNLELEAKASAYDLSRNSSLCQYTVVCESWTQDPEIVE